MIRSTLGASIGAALVIATPATAQRGGDVPKLLPMPQSLTRGSGTLTIAAGADVAADTPLARSAATLLVDHVRTARGIVLAPAETATARIRFVADPSIKGDEAYRLTVARDGIRVAAAAAPGFVHGAMTLVQLLSPDAHFGQSVRVPAVTIEDSPRFAWRGLMLDTARHFLPLPEIEKIVDQMAAVKLNTLHLHLSDDQGWRFEVKRYPKLTEVGAWRTPPSTGGAAPTQRYGGFYTQDELRGLVRYAAERGITIVPEIDLPGHAQALVASYPQFGVLGDRPETGNGWGIFPYLLNPGPEGVAFVKQVLDELIDVFPGTYVHLGGDEAVKDQWERSPAVQAQIKALNLKDENALQSWLIDELGTYLSSKGRRLIGWDEILEGGLPPSASVMSWRGEKGAVDAANQNHDVVLSPAPTMYINYLQSYRADEPPGPIQVQTLADTYAYEPMPKGLDPAKAGHVLGAQMNLWSEYLVTPYQYQHSIFPRLAALAENSWIERPRDFAGFLTRLQPQVARWKRGGVAVADSSAAVDVRLAGTRGDALRGRRVSLTLAQDAPQGTIRYTLDGSAPTPRSRRYAAPLSLALGQTVRAAPFDAAGTALAAPRAFDTGREALLTRVSGEMAACPGETRGLRVPLTADAVANAPTYDVNIFNLCSVYPAAPLDVAGGFTVEVARLARNHGLAHDIDKVRRHFNVTPHGELLVTLGCPAMKDGKPDPDAPRPVIAASFPLPDPASAPQRLRFTGTLPAMDGDRDLCFQFTSPLTEPLYAVERVSLTDRR
ncbi:beta-N-acetylhexosaminidase [Sphingomonas phyllosphaerae]|uniref:beta-N-acetylhexosaminidase n=1 Tax=Sphingomonas phyllosphaerae TaxID=257003 RepID=UPI0024139321|nr:family 20 glycosylhydrolase [Sphingomonas phyllosphaerae]